RCPPPPPADRIGDWHAAGPNVTPFMNALSLLFPAGERMFIDAVRSYRDGITDAGLPANKLGKFTWRLLDVIQHKTPKSTPLAATVALAHYTALMGHMLPHHREQLAGSQEDYARM
ncbi:metal-dependent hydrolase, partial [Salinisphaera sp. SWV1]|uniref:metal-dependent hydrolase n=1 Tax=Salinisphaera sp. SWV1 TaxID=3454139 RepID=UPI003F84B480